MYTFIHCRILEREDSAFCHDGFSMEQHRPHQKREQQQHDDTANLVSQFIIEEILVTMRKSLGMETKSYLEEEQHHLIGHSHLISKYYKINIIVIKKVKGNS